VANEGESGLRVEGHEARVIGGMAARADPGGVTPVEAERSGKGRIAHDRVDGIVATGTVTRLALHTRQALLRGSGVTRGTPRIATLLGGQSIEGSGVRCLPPLLIGLGVARPAAQRADQIAGDGLGPREPTQPQSQTGDRGAVARGA